MSLRRVLLLAILAASLAFTGCRGGEAMREELATRLAEADEIFRSEEYDEAGTLYERIAEDASAAHDDATYVEACAMRARSHLIADRADDGRPWIERAAAHADVSEPLGWSRFLGVRGRFEWKSGDNETATATFREMFDYCNEHDLYERAVDAAHMVAITGNTAERFEWAQRGIEMAEKGELAGWLGPLWNNLGWDYVDAERYDEAQAALEKAREYHYESESDLPKLIADYSVAHVTRLRGDYRAAKVAMDEVYRWAHRLNEEGNEQAIEWMGMSQWDLGEIAHATGENAVALQQMTMALEALEKAGMPSWDETGYNEKKARLEEIRG
jgi:tetratricopeptide (TPR) repeat protein